MALKRSILQVLHYQHDVLGTLPYYYYNEGKLPVDVDMNRVSEFQKGSFDERATDHESPPPLPPKMFVDDESCLPEEVRVVTETQVPALPPKLVNNSAFQQYQLHTIEF